MARRPADKSEPAALALQMGPGPHQPGALIAERRQFHLQHPFAGLGAGGEDFQYHAGAIQQLHVPGFFQIALLHRGDRTIHQHQPDVVGLKAGAQLVHLTFAKQQARLGLVQANDFAARDVQFRQRARQCQCFIQRRGRSLAPFVGTKVRMQHPRAQGAHGVIGHDCSSPS